MLGRTVGILAALGLLAACSGGGGQGTGTDGGSSGGGSTAAASTATSASGTATVGGTSVGTGTGSSGAGTATASTTAGGADMGVAPAGTCFDEPPDGAQMPPPLPVYPGTCPTIVPGANTIVSSGNDRQFLFVAPTDWQPGERLPVIFLWHWLGGDANGFLEKGDVQFAADTYRFFAVIPEKKGDLPFVWPYAVTDPDARIDEEARFFDDMLACVAEQYDVQPACISSVGVSAGALWTGQLASVRGQYLSSFLSLSGGTGGPFVKPWKGSPHAMPALVLWGGPDDTCIVINFQETSLDLEQNLTADGHALVECIHNCGHGVPPIEVDGAPTPFAMLWQFVLDHPYWLPDGVTPYASGLPPEVPEFCAVGMGNAVPREGPCDPPGC